jgi:iron complex transport system substrate-binding protein
VSDVPRIGPSFPSPNLELIIELEPDVVFGAVFDVRDQLESAGLTVITPVSFITQIQDLLDLIAVMGLVLDRTDTARDVIRQIALDIVEIEGVVIQQAPVRTALLFPSADSPPFASGSGSFENELLLRAGGDNIFSDVAGFPQVSFEAVIERDPEVIFVDVSQVEAITSNPLLAEVTAVKNNNVIGINASSLTSTRVAESLEIFARALHPDAFPE